jgi:hypothetical protein
VKKVYIAAGLAALTPAAILATGARAHAATTPGNCSNTTLVHFFPDVGQNTNWNSWSHCFGGVAPPAWTGSVPAAQICGGNNTGWYGIGSPFGTDYNAGFGRGTTWVQVPEPGALQTVYISSWKGNDRCG